MKHSGTVRLETKRLILRRLELSDAEDAYHNWTNDGEVTKFLTWPTHENIQMTRNFIQSNVDQYDKESDFYSWGIECKEIGQVIGSIGAVNVNERAESVHIGYCIGKAYWNRGIISEAFGAVIQYLFEVVEVNRIDSRHDPRNPYSGKVMEKCGLIYEGTLRQSDRNNQGICDAAWYGLLKAEWKMNNNYNER